MHSREAGSDNGQAGSPGPGFPSLGQRRARSILTVKDDDPAVAPTGLGVVPEANTAALSTGCLPVLPVIRVVSTEARVARLYPGKLPQQRSST